MYAESTLLKLIKYHKKNPPKRMSGGAVGLLPLIQGREMFFVSVFMTLIFQTSLTFGLMLYTKDVVSFQQKAQQYIFLLFILQIAIIIVLAFLPMHPILKFVLFTVFSIITGIILSTVASMTSQDIIKTALSGTVAIFVAMLVFGVVLSALGLNLNWMTGLLFFALLTLILIRIVMLFMRTSNDFKKYIAIASLLLFGVFIIYDTNNILQRDYNGDFVTASLDYFLDIINTFINLLQLTGLDK